MHLYIFKEHSRQHCAFCSNPPANKQSREMFVLIVDRQWSIYSSEYLFGYQSSDGVSLGIKQYCLLYIKMRESEFLKKMKHFVYNLSLKGTQQ